MFFTRLPPVGILEAVSTPPKHGKIKKAGPPKRVTSHPFRHSFATRSLADGYDIRTVQELLGHKDVQTTMIHTHVLNRAG